MKVDSFSINITISRNVKLLNELSSFLFDPRFDKYIRLVPEGQPDDTIITNIFLSSENITNNSEDEYEVFCKLNSLYLLLVGVLALFYEDVSRSQGFTTLYKNHDPNVYRNIYNVSSQIPMFKDISYGYPFKLEDDINVFNEKICEEDYKNSLVLMRKIMLLAIGNEYLCKTIMQFGFDDSWGRLYSIWDNVYHSVKEREGLKNKKSVIDFLGLNRDEIDRLQGCANSYGLLFLDARHGELGFSIPNKIITKEDAVKVTRKIILHYIDYIAR